jgi:four helix bundle protein
MAVKVYKVTASFPRSEAFGITNQLRRAAASVPANIVEGNSRNSKKEYLHFLYNARGSLEEVRYFLLFSRDLGYLKQEVFEEIERGYETVSRLLNPLTQSLKGNS